MRTPPNPADSLLKRARRKWLSTAVATNLAEYAKGVSSPLEKAYRNSVYCVENLEQIDGRLTGKYCGNRWCLTCSAIRTARAWDGYEPVLQDWKDAQLVTVTIRNVPAAELRPAIEEMLQVSRRITDSMKRTDKVPLIALRKLECTHNPERNDYHPHFHLIVQTRQMARLFVARWLEQFGERADAKAQNVKPAKRGALAELLKYFTKLVAKTKLMPVAALDVIFTAIKGRRTYQPIGFQKADEDGDDDALEFEEGTAAISRPGETVDWTWAQLWNDWVDGLTGECLTGYEPVPGFRRFIESIA